MSVLEKSNDFSFYKNLRFVGSHVQTDIPLDSTIAEIDIMFDYYQTDPPRGLTGGLFSFGFGSVKKDGKQGVSAFYTDSGSGLQIQHGQSIFEVPGHFFGTLRILKDSVIFNSTKGYKYEQGGFSNFVFGNGTLTLGALTDKKGKNKINSLKQISIISISEVKVIDNNSNVTHHLFPAHKKEDKSSVSGGLFDIITGNYYQQFVFTEASKSGVVPNQEIENPIIAKIEREKAQSWAEKRKQDILNLDSLYIRKKCSEAVFKIDKYYPNKDMYAEPGQGRLADRIRECRYAQTDPSYAFCVKNVYYGNGIFSFDCAGNRYIPSISRTEYRPIKGMMQGSYCKVSFKIDKKQIKIVIKEGECLETLTKYSSTTGAVTYVDPKDKHKVLLGCTTGKPMSFVSSIDLEYGQKLLLPMTSVCKHKNYRASDNQSYNMFDSPTCWEHIHNETITINISEIAKLNNITQEQLAKMIVANDIEFFPTTDKSVNKYPIELYDFDKYAIRYIFYRLFLFGKYDYD